MSNKKDKHFVLLYTLKPLNQLKKFGNIHGISKRLKVIHLFAIAAEDSRASHER